MTHSAELFTANTLTILRSLRLSQDVESGVHVVPEFYFSWDREEGDVALSMNSVPGTLCTVWGKIAKTPRWLTLNAALGVGDFEAGDVLGVIAEIEGCAGSELAPFIRSQHAGNETDTHFGDTIQGSEDRSVHTLLHKVGAQDGLTGEAGFHTLIIPLPKRDFTLELRDLRIFVVPADRGLTLKG